MVSKDDVLNALAEEWGLTDATDDEFTQSDLEEALRATKSVVSSSTISRKLSIMADEGIIEHREVRAATTGGRCKAYKPAEGKTWDDVLQYIKKK